MNLGRISPEGDIPGRISPAGYPKGGYSHGGEIWDALVARLVCRIPLSTRPSKKVIPKGLFVLSLKMELLYGRTWIEVGSPKVLPMMSLRR